MLCYTILYYTILYNIIPGLAEPSARSGSDQSSSETRFRSLASWRKRLVPAGLAATSSWIRAWADVKKIALVSFEAVALSLKREEVALGD